MSDQINDFLAEPIPRKVLFFDSMLTPSLIQPLYWLGLLAIAWNAIGHFFTNGFFGIFEAILIFIVSAIALRVIAELSVLLFKIHENLAHIAGKTEPVAQPNDEDKSVIAAESD